MSVDKAKNFKKAQIPGDTENRKGAEFSAGKGIIAANLAKFGVFGKSTENEGSER